MINSGCDREWVIFRLGRLNWGIFELETLIGIVVGADVCIEVWGVFVTLSVVDSEVIVVYGKPALIRRKVLDDDKNKEWKRVRNPDQTDSGE